MRKTPFKSLTNISSIFGIWVFGLLCLGFIGLVLGTIIIRGLPAITPQFLIQPSQAFGAGGIRYQMLGTTCLTVFACLICAPIALGTAIYQTQFASPRYKKLWSTWLHTLNATPTIIFGLFGYMIFGLLFKWGQSFLTGSFILAMMILPTVTFSVRDALMSIEDEFVEEGHALGFHKTDIIRYILVPQSFYGLITGVFIGMARAAGETAAIMFTATTFSGSHFPTAITQPVATLQTHILLLSQEAVSSTAISTAWGSTIVLVGLVFVFNTIAILIRKQAARR